MIIDKLKKHYTFQQQRNDVLILFSEREDIQTGLKMTMIVLNVLWRVLTLPLIPFKWCIKKVKSRLWIWNLLLLLVVSFACFTGQNLTNFDVFKQYLTTKTGAFGLIFLIYTLIVVILSYFLFSSKCGRLFSIVLQSIPTAVLFCGIGYTFIHYVDRPYGF